jgi:5-methylcytosine-specific restriction endonuclease McrA
MKPHTKIYMDYFGYDISDFIPCEVCGKTAIDIHHIEARQMGGTTTKDNIENLMALCREDHLKYGDKKQHKEWLKSIHEQRLSMAK